MKSLRKRAVVLRKSGWSYTVISEKLGLAKSTLSDWLRYIPYTPNAAVIKRIRTGPAKAAASKQRTRLAEINLLRDAGDKEIGKISNRDLLFLGIGLYMGEGSKLYEMTRFINADPKIVNIAIEWFKKVCKVPKRNFSVRLHIYPDISEKQAIAYWTKVTGLSSRQFEKVQVDRRLNKSMRKRGHLPYGTVHLKVRSLGERRFGVTLHRRIMGWIESVYQKINAGVTQW